MKKGGLRHTTRVPHFSRSLREVGISVTTRAFTFSPANTAHVTFGARIGQSSLPFLRPLSNNTSQSHWVALRRLGGGPGSTVRCRTALAEGGCPHIYAWQLEPHNPP